MSAPTLTSFDAAYRELVDAFNHQTDLRATGASLAALAAGNQRLHAARMAMVEQRRSR